MPNKSSSVRNLRGPGRWAGVPAADRRAERRTQLLDVGFELLGTEGAPPVSVRSVYQRAGLNPRYFYESFDDLDAFIVAVYDRVVDELSGAVVHAARSAAPDPEAQVRAVVDGTVRFIDKDRRRGRVLYAAALDNEALNRRRIDGSHALVDLIVADARSKLGPQPRGEHVRQLAAAMLVGGFSEMLAAWVEDRIKVSRNQLVEDATVLVLAIGEAAGTIAVTRRTRGRKKTA